MGNGVGLMSKSGFNTLEYVRRLKEAGVPEKQAEVQASTTFEIIDSHLATTRDIKALELKIEDVRKDLSQKMVITSGSFTAVILSALVALSKFGLLN